MEISCDRPQIASLAAMLKALGDPTRLQIFLFLRDECSEVVIEEGGAVRPFASATVGEVCCHITGLDKVSSTISFHLKELRISGLINMEKQGRHMICSVNQEAIGRLAQIFQIPISKESQSEVNCCE